ncbi:MAG TPA: hypothetical protein PKC39_01470 [Ferruginibacter sp.]|nr:hypothetical protein [Ferruginibacter sp.]HMP19603.1 hypothetical protein [Ferruginibacter sp.]
MQFSKIINAQVSSEADRPLMQKETYPVLQPLQQYLQQYKRDIELPLTYDELLHYRYTDSIRDEDGRHTHWENVVYDKKLQETLFAQCLSVYGLLTQTATTGLTVTAIDFCEFANSMPFRITVADNHTGQQDCFYIKAADTSRVFGLELEHLLSPNRTSFLYHNNTLIEAHIEGIPGDVFLQTAEALNKTQKQALAKAFVSFNERCFARLLGDMRSYNFVVTAHPHHKEQYHIRAIDFDQQCYEGNMNLYLPQFYKENYGYVQMALNLHGHDSIEQIRENERHQLALQAKTNATRLQQLFAAMAGEEISENYKVLRLSKELNEYHGTTRFSPITHMGGLVQQQLLQVCHL